MYTLTEEQERESRRITEEVMNSPTEPYKYKNEYEHTPLEIVREIVNETLVRLHEFAVNPDDPEACEAYAMGEIEQLPLVDLRLLQFPGMSFEASLQLWASWIGQAAAAWKRIDDKEQDDYERQQAEQDVA